MFLSWWCDTASPRLIQTVRREISRAAKVSTLEWLEADTVKSPWLGWLYCSSPEIPRRLEISLCVVCTNSKMIVSPPHLAAWWKIVRYSVGWYLSLREELWFCTTGRTCGQFFYFIFFYVARSWIALDSFPKQIPDAGHGWSRPEQCFTTTVYCLLFVNQILFLFVFNCLTT